MSTYVPAAVQTDLDAARIRRLKSKSRIRIETADGYFRALRLWDTGFSVAAEDKPLLRGYVDLYEGPTHLFQGLIVASEEEAGEVRYDFKRMTAVHQNAPRDFVVDAEEPVAFLDHTVLTT